ncbi:hypothetical protein GCM10007161_13270 [Ignatzschineria indica]|nr:P-loop NTPase fold protein [Ignatzschineria indica]GGZ83157.1 hypothetical protein GCM10007161_13270 [Ignatzschineria indica]
MYTVKDIKFENRDEYERLPKAKRILDIIKKNGSSPIFIDGAWGAGKTEFCYKLFHFLKESDQENASEDAPKLIVSYINSFAGDYQSNPFMLIVQAIYNSLITKEAPPSEVEKVQEKLAKGIHFAKKLVTAGFRGTSFKITPPLIGVEMEVSGKDIVNAAKESLEKSSDEEFKVAFFDELENFRLQSEQLLQFKQAINDAMGGRKIVLIIDELDRCRPDYALELLENVKHIFEIEDLFIIFSANKKQLEAMVHKRYGYGMDAEGYLEKFYKVSITLTSVVSVAELDKTHGFTGHLKVFYDAYTKCSGSVPRMNFTGIPFVKDLLGTLETRKLESIAENLHNYFILTGKSIDEYLDSHLSVIILGVYLFAVNPEILREIENNSGQDKLRDYINKLPVGDIAIAEINEFVDLDIKNMNATQDGFLYGRKASSVIVNVRNALI